MLFEKLNCFGELFYLLGHLKESLLGFELVLLRDFGVLNLITENFILISFNPIKTLGWVDFLVPPWLSKLVLCSLFTNICLVPPRLVSIGVISKDTLYSFSSLVISFSLLNGL